jgi:hypothetical protein
MGDMYAVVNKAKTVLSGVFMHREMSWQRIGTLNSRYDWKAKRLGITFVDPNSWIEDSDFSRIDCT